MTFKELIATLNEVSKLAITVAGGLGGLVAWWNNASLAVVVAYALGASLLVSLVVLAWRAFGVKATVRRHSERRFAGLCRHVSLRRRWRSSPCSTGVARCSLQLECKAMSTYEFRCQDCCALIVCRMPLAVYLLIGTPRCPRCESQKVERPYTTPVSISMGAKAPPAIKHADQQSNERAVIHMKGCTNGFIEDVVVANEPATAFRIEGSSAAAKGIAAINCKRGIEVIGGSTFHAASVYVKDADTTSTARR
jgi:hypothetical protein